MMQRISFLLFIFLLIFSPLAFGSVETWALTIMETCSAVSFLLLAMAYFLTRSPGMAVPGIVPLFLILGFTILQLVPLPTALVQILSPATFEIYRPLLELDPAQGLIPLTVHRKSTLLLLFTFSAYGLVYLLTIYHCSKAERLKKTVTIVIVLGALIAIEAIIQKLTSPGTIYWFRSTPNSSPVGPWVYSNHFAGYMEMLFPLTIALFLYYLPGVSYEKSIRHRFISALTMPGANRYLLLGTAAMLMAVSILFSTSRGGIITLSLAFFFFVLFSARTSPNARTRWPVMMTLLVVLMISWLGWQPIIAKFGTIWGDTGINTGGRLPVLFDSFDLIRSFPLFGTGLGTFVHVYPGVRTVPGESLFDHAHNDYIELLATGGIIGFLLCGWFVLAVLIHSIQTMKKRRDRYAILLTSGALTGLLALLFHSQSDFQIYNGANGLYFFFLCGLAVSAANTRLQYRSRSTLLEKRNYPVLLYPACFAFLFLVCCSVYKVQAHRAEQLSAPLGSIFINKHMTPRHLGQMHATAAQSAHLDPLDAAYPFRLGRLSTLLNKDRRARREYLQACMIEPTSGHYLQQLAICLDTDLLALKKDLLLHGLARNPLLPSLYLTYSEWLFQNDLRREAFSVLNQAMHKIPGKTNEIIGFMLPLRFTSTEVEQMLPVDLPAPWYEAGRTMERNERLDKAEFFYRRSIEIAGYNKAQPAFFDSLYRLYRRQKNETRALETLRMGIRYLPDYAPFRIKMGDYYLKEGIRFRAAEEYAQVLRLDPENTYIRRKLEALQ